MGLFVSNGDTFVTKDGRRWIVIVVDPSDPGAPFEARDMDNRLDMYWWAPDGLPYGGPGVKDRETRYANRRIVRWTLTQASSLWSIEDA